MNLVFLIIVINSDKVDTGIKNGQIIVFGFVAITVLIVIGTLAGENKCKSNYTEAVDIVSIIFIYIISIGLFVMSIMSLLLT